MSKKDIFEHYLNVNSGDYKQSEDKIKLFKYNYAKYFPTDKDARLLDIGPGCGEMLTLWNQSGYKNIVAVDISREVVEHCKERGLDEVTLIAGLCDFLKGEKEAYDFITMIEVIEHIKKDEILEVCNSIRRSLKPKGRVIIETPNMGAIFGSLLRYYDFTHEMGFTSHSLLYLMETVGFNQIEIKGFEGIIKKDLRSMVRKFFRDSLLYPAMRVIRKMNDSDLTEIFLPYIYATGIK